MFYNLLLNNALLLLSYVHATQFSSIRQLATNQGQAYLTRNITQTLLVSSIHMPMTHTAGDDAIMMKCCKSGSHSRVELNHKNNNKTHINYVSSRGETKQRGRRRRRGRKSKSKYFQFKQQSWPVLLFAIINYVMSTTTREHPSVFQKLLYICYDDYTLLWISYVTFVLVTHLIRIVNY